MHAIGGQDRQIAVGQEEHIAGVAENRGDIRCHEVLVIPEADHDGRAIARRHDLVRIGARNHGQREHAGELFDRRAHGLFEIRLEVLLDEVGHDLGIGFGSKNVAFRFQLVLQGEVVFDDTVVYDDDVAVAIAVGVGILFRRTAMGGPTGVTDAEAPGQRIGSNGIFEVVQLAFGAANLELSVIAVDRQSRRIVSPIFQPFQSIQNDWHCVVCPYIPDDSAHAFIIRVSLWPTPLHACV